MGHEVVDGGVLVEVIGGVGLAFGDCAVADVVIGIGFRLAGNQLVADVVTILLVILGGAAAEEIIRIGIGTNFGAIGVSIRDFRQ